MSRQCLIVLIAFVNTYVAAQEVSCQAYHEYEIIPDILRSCELPAGYLSVQYSDGTEVKEGNVLTPTKVRDIPAISWDASSKKFHTIMMVDPDVPSREEPTSRNWLHWMVGNVLGTDITSGETIAEYIGSGPSQGSGLHRYVFLVYEQPEELLFHEPRLTNRSAENRSLFSIDDFLEKYSLGKPTAGNFYQAEWDDYVPILYQQLGI